MCGIFALRFAFQRSVRSSVFAIRSRSRDQKCSHVRYTLLGPFQIALHLLGSFHAIGEIGTGAFETALSQGLQLEQLTVFGVEFTRSATY